MFVENISIYTIFTIILAVEMFIRHLVDDLYFTKSEYIFGSKRSRALKKKIRKAKESGAARKDYWKQELAMYVFAFRNKRKSLIGFLFDFTYTYMLPIGFIVFSFIFPKKIFVYISILFAFQKLGLVVLQLLSPYSMFSGKQKWSYLVHISEGIVPILLIFFLEQR